jgi:hypothetical protein
MTIEIEPITLVFPNLNTTVELPMETAAHIWNAVKRGEAANAEEYVIRILLQRLASGTKNSQTAQPEEVVGQDDTPGST